MKESIELFTDCYLPAKPFPALKKEVIQSIKSLKPLWQGLGLHKPRIGYAKELDACAIYCNGSMDYPVFVIDVDAFDDDSLNLSIAVYSTIIHELLHAYLETIGMHCTDYEHPEDDIETLTRCYSDGIIKISALIKELDRLADLAMV